MNKTIKNPAPFNFRFSILYREYPRELHEELNVPGIYKKNTSIKVHQKDGQMLEMDASYIVDPDFKTIFEESIINLEHQSYTITKEKIRIMSKYALQQIHDEKLPQLSVVASHIKKEKHEQEYEISPSLLMKPYFLDLGSKNISKRLSKLRTKLENNEYFDTKDALNIGIITVFAPRNKAKNITEETVKIYCKISNQLSTKMELTLYIILFTMINAYFDSEKEVMRIINMLQNKTSEETLETFKSFDIIEEKLQNQIKTNEQTINQLTTELNQRTDEIKQVNNELNKKTDEIKQVNNELNKKTDELNHAHTKIKKLENQIKGLKSQSNSK